MYKDIKSFSIIDERSSAYVGLGKTKSDSLNRPVLIITTSGTAVANLFPAIVESFMSKVALNTQCEFSPIDLRLE